MGKKWDVKVPNVKQFAEILRVLKPGKFAFIMSSPRQDVLAKMIVNLWEAGFDTNFTSIYWIYASGFPKAGNIKKLVQKRTGEEAQALEGSYAGFQPKPAVEVILVAMKPLTEKTFIDQALKNKGGLTWLDDCRVPTSDVRAYPNGVGGYGGDHIQQLNKRNPKAPYFGSEQGRFPANLLVSDKILDDGKISSSKIRNPTQKNIYGYGSDNWGKDNTIREQNDSGGFSRYFDLDTWFAKNIQLYMPSAFPFLYVPKPSPGEKNIGLNGDLAAKSKRPSGSLWNEGEFATGVSSTIGQIDPEYQFTDGKTNNWIENDYRKGKGEKTTKKQFNNHPTTKPIKIGTYLITLGLGLKRKNYTQTVLDPFMGSGTFGLSALLLGKKFIGVEMEERSFQIAKARVDALDQYKRKIDYKPKINSKKLNL